jgi:hypothetical protein
MSRFLALCGVLLAVTPAPAAAEWHLTPLIGLTFSGNTTLSDLDHGTDNVHGNYGASATLFGRGIFGVEAVAIHTPHFFRGAQLFEFEHSSATSIMGNVVVTTPRKLTEYFLRPFVSAGFGVLHVASVEVQPVLPFRVTMAGFNLGGGAVGFFSQRTGVRFDLRYHTSLHRQGQEVPAYGRPHVRYMTAAIGIVFRR